MVRVYKVNDGCSITMQRQYVSSNALVSLMIFLNVQSYSDTNSSTTFGLRGCINYQSVIEGWVLIRFY